MMFQAGTLCLIFNGYMRSDCFYIVCTLSLLLSVLRGVVGEVGGSNVLYNSDISWESSLKFLCRQGVSKFKVRHFRKILRLA